MYTEEQLDKLEQEEHSLTEETLVAILLVLTNAKLDLENELHAFYRKYGKDGVITLAEARKWVSKKDHRRRIVLLWLLTHKIFDKAAKEIRPLFRRLLEDVSQKELDFFKVKLSSEDIDKIIYKEWGDDNLNWLDRLDNDFELWESRLNKQLKTDFIHAESEEDVLDNLYLFFDKIERVLKKLVYTESTADGSRIRNEIFDLMGVKKYIFYSRVDERRCEYCGALHGKTFLTTEFEVGVTASPIHPRCRCWEVPIID